MYEIALPQDDEADNVVVGQFGGENPPAEPPAEVPADQVSPGMQLVVLARRELVPRVKQGFSDAVVGETLLAKQPASILTLVRQYLIEPPPYIREALILRVPYALYGIPVITVNVVGQTLFLIIRYPSLLAATALIAGVVVLVGFILA
ncbi:hypothetical protein AB0K21_22220 [Streptosporangium sp. NPDC049248]|uniref:hypothetical protein n=1 Tax=Streptosporangium sp. NPDC049248 TaxID=3155651 RepID=UPI003416FB91